MYVQKKGVLGMNATVKKTISRLVGEMEELRASMDNIKSAFESIKDDERELYDGLSEKAQESDKGQERLDLCDKLDEIYNAMDESITEWESAGSLMQEIT